MSLYYRVLRLAQDLRVDTEKAVVRKYLTAVPGSPGELLRDQVYLQLGEHARLLEVAQLHDRLQRTLRAFPLAARRASPPPRARPKVQWHRTRGEGLRAYTAAEGTAGPGACWVCASTAHSTRGCPHRKTRHQVLTCTACERKGHVEGVCWQKHPEMRPTPEQFERATRGATAGYRPGGPGRGRNPTPARRGGVSDEDGTAQAAQDDPDEFLDLWEMLWEEEARAAEGVLEAELAEDDPPIPGYAGLVEEGSDAEAEEAEPPQPQLVSDRGTQPQASAFRRTGEGRQLPASYDVATQAEEAELGELQQATSNWADVAVKFLRGKQEAWPGHTLEAERQRAALEIIMEAVAAAPSTCPVVAARVAPDLEPCPPPPASPLPTTPGSRAASSPSHAQASLPPALLAGPAAAPALGSSMPSTLELGGGAGAHDCRGPGEQGHY